MSTSYRVGFGLFGKFVIVTALGAMLAGGIAMADAKPRTAAVDTAAVEVVRLEPVSVTISNERFAAIRAGQR